MGAYTVYKTDSFEKIFMKLDRSEQIWIEKTKLQLEEDPHGKILRYSQIREKKYLNKRLYYIVDEQTKRILVVDYGRKKDQQATINMLVNNLTDLLEFLRTL